MALTNCKEIRRLKKEGLTLTQIAKELDIQYGTVRNVFKPRLSPENNRNYRKRNIDQKPGYFNTHENVCWITGFGQ